MGGILCRERPQEADGFGWGTIYLWRLVVYRHDGASRRARGHRGRVGQAQVGFSMSRASLCQIIFVYESYIKACNLPLDTTLWRGLQRVT